jgi:hypothetical protein
MAIDKIQSESINLADTFAFTGTVTGAGGVNTPFWDSRHTSNQSISHDSYTKLLFPDEVIDTASAFDATNSKFVVPSGQAGKYFISISYEMEVQTNPTYAYIYINGSASNRRFKMSSYSNRLAMVVSLSVGDYVEGYTYQASGGSVNALANRQIFQGFKIIE